MDNELNSQYEELRAQVVELTNRVNQLEQEVTRLKLEPAQPIKARPVSGHNQPAAPTVTQRVDTRTVASRPTPKKPYEAKKVVNKEKGDIENRIGKNLMAIIASVLILFSIILFGGLILPYITDGVRYGIMLLVSIAFAVAGIRFMDKQSKFYGLFSAMAALGVSGFYITNLIAYFGFEIINSIVLMALIVIWLIVTIILCKIKSKMFLIISNIGLVVASILATANWSAMYIGVFVYIVGIIVLYLLNKSEDYNKDAYVFLQVPVMLGIFADYYRENWQIIIFVVIASLVYILPQFLYTIRNSHIPVMVITLVMTNLFNWGAVFYLWDDGISYGAIVAISMILIATIVRFKRSNDCMAIVYVTHYMMIVSLYTLNHLVGYGVFIGFYGIALVLLAIGYYKKSDHFKYPGFAYLLLAILVPPEFFDGYVTSVFGLIILAVLYYITYKKYKATDKYLCTLLLGASILMLFIHASLGIVFWFVAYSSICLYMCSGFFLLNSVTKEKELAAEILSYISSGVMLVFAIFMLVIKDLHFTIDGIDYLSEGFTFVIILLVTLVLCIMNCKRILTSALPKYLAGFYTCFKFMLFMLLLLNRFEIESFGLTLCTFLFAVICIAIGFVKKYKPSRIYGLILTLISVLKLALFDIEYDSNLLRPVGFLIAGLLCFGISWGYTVIEKHQEKGQEKL